MGLKLGYKQTEVGVIPEEWEVAKLGSLIEYTKGYAFKSSEYSSHGVRVVRVSDTIYDSILEENPVFVPESKASQYAKWRLRKDDLVISTVGSKPPMYDSIVGKVIMIPQQHEDALLNQNAVLIRDKKRRMHFQQILLGHFRTKRYLTWIESIFRGNANQASITLKELFEFNVPFPVVEAEQRAIAGALSDVDALIGALAQLIAKKHDLKQAVMQQLLTGRTRLPGFRGDWEVKRLGDVAALNRMNVIPASSPDQLFVHFSLPAFDAGEVPVVEPGSAIGSNKFRVPQNAILVSKLNPRIPRVWAPTEIPAEAIASTEFLVFTPKEGVSRSFLYVICSSPSFCEQMELSATGTTGSHQRISPAGALDLTVSVPVDVDEQTAIAAVLSDMDTEIEALERRLAKTRALKQGMMQELLTGKTRLTVS